MEQTAQLDVKAKKKSKEKKEPQPPRYGGVRQAELRDLHAITRLHDIFRPVENDTRSDAQKREALVDLFEDNTKSILVVPQLGSSKPVAGGYAILAREEEDDIVYIDELIAYPEIAVKLLKNIVKEIESENKAITSLKQKATRLKQDDSNKPVAILSFSKDIDQHFKQYKEIFEKNGFKNNSKHRDAFDYQYDFR